MATTTIRDLAFKVTLDINLKELKNANAEVDKFKKNMVGLGKSARNTFGYVQRGFDSISSAKMVSELNKIKQAKEELDKIKPPKVVKETTEPSNRVRGGITGGSKDIAGLIGSYISLRTVMNSINKTMEQSQRNYREYIQGMARGEAFFANSLKYRTESIEGSNKKAMGSFKGYLKASKESLMEARKNVSEVANTGVVSENALNTAVGQLASFQLDTDMWFGGDQGKKMIGLIGDYTTAVYGANASSENAVTIANQVGKVSQGLWGNFSRNGVVMTEYQKQVVKTGTESEKFAIILQVLEQNVGNLSKTMIKTPMGKNAQLTNKLKKEYTDLGEVTMSVKNSFIEGRLAMFGFNREAVELTNTFVATPLSKFSQFMLKMRESYPALSKVGSQIVVIGAGILAVAVALSGIGLAISLLGGVASLGVIASNVLFIGVLITSAKLSFDSFMYSVKTGKGVFAPIVNALKKMKKLMVDIESYGIGAWVKHKFSREKYELGERSPHKYQEAIDNKQYHLVDPFVRNDFMNKEIEKRNIENNIFTKVQAEDTRPTIFRANMLEGIPMVVQGEGFINNGKVKPKDIKINEGASFNFEFNGLDPNNINQQDIADRILDTFGNILLQEAIKEGVDTND